MPLIDRHNKILKTVELLRTVSVQELKERLDVSEVTIRKDLNFLEDQGLILRTHGGARLAQDSNRMHTLNIRERENPDLKRLIAEKAATLINEGDTVYLDSGSTCQALAEELRDGQRSVRVISNALPILNILADCESIILYTIGGSFRREAGSFVGPLSLSNLADYQIETGFVGTTGYDNQGVFSSQNVIESQLKKQVLASSKRRVILADSTKADIRAFSVFARPGEVDILITDSGCNYCTRFRELGIEVLIARKEDQTEEENT
jgi:DeoR/GlpR family transcriptional regulator of sugar metabolism